MSECGPSSFVTPLQISVYSWATVRPKQPKTWSGVGLRCQSARSKLVHRSKVYGPRSKCTCDLVDPTFWSAETKISVGPSRVTMPAELNEMVQYPHSQKYLLFFGEGGDYFALSLQLAESGQVVSADRYIHPSLYEDKHYSSPGLGSHPLTQF